MSTMYEMIMDLPLFKGVSKEHVSYFLEKTNVNFENFEPGMKIVVKGEEVRMVKFVLSGEVCVSHTLNDCNISVDEYCSYGRVLGADRLYGMATGYSCDVTARTRTSIMEFSKDQYVRLLNSDNIYLLNFFNFLSRRVQKPVEVMEEFTSGNIKSRLCVLLGVLTDPDSIGVIINGTIADLAKYVSVDQKTMAEWINSAELEGLIEYSDGIMRIKSRGAFLS